MPERAIRRVLSKKYEFVEESTSQSLTVSENDDKNPSGQSTVQISGEGDYEPAEEIKTFTSKNTNRVRN